MTYFPGYALPTGLLIIAFPHSECNVGNSHLSASENGRPDRPRSVSLSSQIAKRLIISDAGKPICLCYHEVCA